MAIARPLDQRLFFHFDRAHTQLAKVADTYLERQASISRSQAAVLIYLGYHEPCTLSDLASGIGRQNPAVTGLVNRMETAGLVARGPKSALGVHDGRTKTVALTEAGRQCRAKVMEASRVLNEQLLKGFTDQEIEIVLKFLSQAVENTHDVM